ncbi:hypothetical protein NY406_09835 [Chlorobaculum sp. MV4-Y]|uniref:DUF6858 family protein n=1 Tax=Chlorobaculum sp. MV4-Y TaxID=2976335 RepID=UPI0021B0367F|nr:hypothetical protein [Chlorobaculum sp. MV4-Y]UWX57493.1 hypothetical protein NY406_09835 [Chlorobaculum sp. MV4-Y]
MKQILLQEKYPIYILELDKEETSCRSVDEIIAYYREKIESHPFAVLIGEFDHYGHTALLPDGQIGEGISAGKNIVFCFGKELMNPKMLAVRPRSIGVAEMSGHFVISFLEAPNPAANASMEEWTLALRNPVPA